MIERDTDRDFWMTAYQAVDYGIIDEVLEPNSASDEDDTKDDKKGNKAKKSAKK